MHSWGYDADSICQPYDKRVHRLVANSAACLVAHPLHCRGMTEAKCFTSGAIQLHAFVSILRHSQQHAARVDVPMVGAFIIFIISSSSCLLVVPLGLPQAPVAVGLVLSCCWKYGMHTARHAGLHLGAAQSIAPVWPVAM